MEPVDLFLRLLLFFASLFLSENPSAPVHFTHARMACIALDVFAPLVIAGHAVEMEDSNSRKHPSCGTTTTGRKAAVGHDERQERTRQAAAPELESVDGPKQEAAMEDLKHHGTQMTVQDRKTAEEILKTKYGASDRQ
ncbi:hypothetical protein ACSSS7_007203 [Eimeria intestinalis]